MDYVISPEQLNFFIKKFYGPLEMISTDNGKYMSWRNRDGEKIFELTNGTDMTINRDYFYLLMDFMSPSNSKERAPIMKELHKYLEELSGKKIRELSIF